MKKQFNLALITLFLCTLCGCNNLFFNRSDYATSPKIRVNLGVNTRTVKSVTAAEDLTNLKLVAKSAGKDDKTLFENKTYAQIVDQEFEIEAGTYNFVLTACDNERNFKATLNNKAIADGVTPLPFVLELTRIDWGTRSGEGSFKVTLTAPVDQIGKVLVTLYDKQTGAAVTGFTNVPVALVDGKYVFEDSAVKVGDYRATYVFYGTDNATVIGNYSEIITVSKNKTSNAERTITTLNTADIPVKFGGQKQGTNGGTTHLNDYQYFYDPHNQTGGNNSLKQIGAKGTFNVTVPAAYADKKFTQMVLYVPEVEFTTDYTLNAASGTFEPVASDIHFLLELESIKASDGQVTLNAMLPSFDGSKLVGGVSNKIILTLVDSASEYYVAYFPGVKVVDGQTYNFDCGSIEHLPHWVQLSNGLKVASHNIGAYSAEDCGMYFSTGDISNALGNDPIFESGCTLMTVDQVKVISDLSHTTTTSWVRGVTVGTGNNTVYFPANGYKTDIRRSFNAEGNYWAATADGNAAIADEAKGCNTHGVSLYADCDGISLATWPKNEQFNLRPVIAAAN